MPAPFLKIALTLALAFTWSIPLRSDEVPSRDRTTKTGSSLSTHYREGTAPMPLPLDRFPLAKNEATPIRTVALTGKIASLADLEAPAMPTITIGELQMLASRHNPTLCQLKQKINAAHGAWVQAGRRPNPSIGYEAEEIGDGGKAGKHGVVLEQEILTGGKRQLDRAVAAWEKDEVVKRWQQQFQAIQNDVRVRAFELLAAQKIVQLNRVLTRIGHENAGVAEELVKAGEVSRIDLLQIRAKANEAKAALKTSTNEELLAWKKLAVMIGCQEMPPHLLIDSLEEVRLQWDQETLWQMILEGSWQLSATKSRIRQAQSALARQRAERVPDVTIGAGVHYDYGERQTLGSFNIGVPLQIFDRNQGNIQKACAELATAKREWERQKLLLYENYVERCTAWESAAEQIRLYREKILPDVQESLELCTKGYKQGEYGSLDLLAVQQLYYETQAQYVQSLKDHATAIVYLEGFLAEGGLDAEE